MMFFLPEQGAREICLPHVHPLLLTPPSPPGNTNAWKTGAVSPGTQHSAHPLGSAQLTSVGGCAQNLNKAILIQLHPILFLAPESLPLWSPLPGLGCGFPPPPHPHTWLPENIVVNQ